jgi:hypothetical protein
MSDPEWVPVTFHDPNDHDNRQDDYPDPEDFYFPDEEPEE